MLKEELLEKYKYKIELHAHSNPVSSCSEIKVKNFVDDFIEDGFTGVALTNHFTPKLLEYKSAQKAAEYYISDFNEALSYSDGRLGIYLGMEIRFTENVNDYLVYGINEQDLEKAYHYLDKGINAFYREFKNDKNIILQAHPFRFDMELADPKSVDGIEVFNFHPGHNSRIACAAEYVADHNMIVTGGIDFHHEHQRKKFAVRCEFLPKDSYDVCELIKSGGLIYTVGESVILP